LVEITKQPVGFLKEVLKEIAVYNTKVRFFQSLQYILTIYFAVNPTKHVGAQTRISILRRGVSSIENILLIFFVISSTRFYTARSYCNTSDNTRILPLTFYLHFCKSCRQNHAYELNTIYSKYGKTKKNIKKGVAEIVRKAVQYCSRLL